MIIGKDRHNPLSANAPGMHATTIITSLYYALQVSCPVERVIGSGSQVLNSVILQIIKAFSLYSDRDRCHSLDN